jgi:hypothetical protein
MWLEKLSSGVLRVVTPVGPRYLRPSLLQRLYLLWVFRNFQTLPVKVLSSYQQRMLESMWAENKFVAFGVGVEDAPLLGTLEQRPAAPAATLPPRRPSGSVTDSVASFAADARRQ